MAMRHRVLVVLLAVLAIAGPAQADLQKATDDLAVTGVGQSVLINVLANDSALGPNLRVLKAFKPVHGSVALEGSGVRYTPAPGFQGSDTFRYMAQSAKSQPGQATVNVEVGAGGVALTLRGRVVDDPVPGAVVTVSIGGFDFVAVADAQGNYEIDIAALRGDAFVTINATGSSSTGADVRFYSLVGEIARLAAAAGGDGVLVRDENNQVQVTNLSTAQYVLLAEANGGSPPDSDQELLPLTQNIDLDELLEVAAVIKLVTDGQVALPAGYADVLALVADEAALLDFKVDNAVALAQAVQEVSADAEITPAYRAGALPAGYAIIPASTPGTINPFAGVARLVSFDGSASSTAGFGKDYDRNFASAPATNWLLVGGDLLVIPMSAFTYYYEDRIFGPNCDGGDFQLINEREVRSRYHRLQDGAGVDYLEIVTTYHRDIVDDDPGDACIAPATGDYDVSVRRLAFEDGAGELAFAPAEAFGRFAIPTWNPQGGYWGAAYFDFPTQPGTVSYASIEGQFDWAVNNGRLQIQTHIAGGGGNINCEYRRYQSDGRKGEGLFVLCTLPDGRKAASYNLAARVDGSLPGFVEANIPGSWLSGATIAPFPGDNGNTLEFYLDLYDDAGHTGRQRLVTTNLPVNTGVGITWAVEGNDFVARGYFRPTKPTPPRNVPSCDGDPVCWQNRQRTWLPVARDGTRHYMIETVSFDLEGSGTLTTGEGGQRINFWEDQTPP